MVTFYRKAQINGGISPGKSLLHSIELPRSSQPGQWNEPEYLGMINPEDDLPYVVVRPKVNRKNNKKILRMRSHWD
ncbi:MAG: hypothetical protein LRY56_01530 [Burkholderiaceae bacterium]|nr:hypothetical protein [Burkholderiaceae bacterium]